MAEMNPAVGLGEEEKEEEEETKESLAVPVEEAKKKKKKKKKKKAPAAPALVPQPRNQDNSLLRKIKDWGSADTYLQTTPPTVPIAAQFPTGAYPVCEIVEYSGEMQRRVSDAECRERERLLSYDYEGVRKAAEAHRQVRRWAQSVLRPGLELHTFAEQLEDYSRQLLQADGLEGGVGFPTGLSLNYIAAHFTPNPGDQVVLQYDDVCKVDIGTHVNGRIVDCAFTVAFNPRYDNLVEAPREATNAGLLACGIDARLGEVGAQIQEVMESYEVELDGRTYPVKSIKNLHGHTIGPYQIHGGKSVPIVRTADNTKMEEGEFYAIETFGSTGKGVVHDDLETSHYMIDYDRFGQAVPLRDPKAKALLAHIEKKYGTLPWCRRHLHRDGQTKHLMPLRNLVTAGIVVPYPPLCDTKGSYVAQFEHTVLLKPTSKEVLSRGDDF